MRVFFSLFSLDSHVLGGDSVYLIPLFPLTKPCISPNYLYTRYLFSEHLSWSLCICTTYPSLCFVYYSFPYIYLVFYLYRPTQNYKVPLQLWPQRNGRPAMLPAETPRRPRSPRLQSTLPRSLPFRTANFSPLLARAIRQRPRRSKLVGDHQKRSSSTPGSDS